MCAGSEDLLCVDDKGNFWFKRVVSIRIRKEEKMTSMTSEDLQLSHYKPIKSVSTIKTLIE